jgi:hypothetical protein
MRRILLDENMPVGVRDQLPGFSVATVPEMGWAGLSNGELLTAAEQAGFEVMVTGDQNIPHQNDLRGVRLAVVVLGTTHWPTIRANPQPVREAVERATQGSYAVVTFPRPRRRRRQPLPRNGMA